MTYLAFISFYFPMFTKIEKKDEAEGENYYKLA
jgi:hypothetical protein